MKKPVLLGILPLLFAGCAVDQEPTASSDMAVSESLPVVVKVGQLDPGTYSVLPLSAKDTALDLSVGYDLAQRIVEDPRRAKSFTVLMKRPKSHDFVEAPAASPKPEDFVNHHGDRTFEVLEDQFTNGFGKGPCRVKVDPFAGPESAEVMMQCTWKFH
jgi:hypothetical protein